MLQSKVLVNLLRVSCCLALLLGVVIALIPKEQVPIHFWDKAEHASGLLLLTLYVGFAWCDAKLVAIAGLMIGYGIAIELLQMLTPWRDASVLDVVADSTGVIIACLLLLIPLLARWRRSLCGVIPA